jgi:hypothetical protein
VDSKKALAFLNGAQYRKVQKRRKTFVRDPGIALIGSNFYKKYTKTINHLDDILFLLCYNFSIYLSVVLSQVQKQNRRNLSVYAGLRRSFCMA